MSAESEAATGVRASRRVRLNASAKWLEPHSTRLVIPSLRLAAHPRLVPRARRCQTIGPPSNCRALEPSAPSAYTPSSPFTAPDEHLDAPLRGRTQRCFAEKLWQVLIYGPRARTPRQGVRSRLRLRPPQDGLRPWLSRGRRAGPQDHLAPAFTGHALPLQRRKGAVVNPQAHALVAAVVRSSLASAERRGSRRAAWENLSSWTVFGPASGPRRFNGHRLRRRRSRCCSVRS